MPTLPLQRRNPEWGVRWNRCGVLIIHRQVRSPKDPPARNTGEEQAATRPGKCCNLEPVHHFDVAIVGGGIIGCAVALELAQNNKKVCVLERNDCGREASWAA